MDSNIKQRVLLHLEMYDGKTHKNSLADFDVSQKGIAKKVGCSRSHLSRVLREMIEENLVLEEKKYLKHKHDRKRKVYFLTPCGKKKEKKLRDELQEETFILKTEDGIKKISGEIIDEYVREENPLLHALVNSDENGILDIVEKKEEKIDVFINRKKELESLEQILEKVKKGKCFTVFLSGRAGTGKTTLATEFERKVNEDGNFEFLRGKAYNGTSDPYLPFKRAFENFMKKDEDVSLSSIFNRDSQINDIIKEKKSLDVERHSIFFDFTNEVRKLANINPLIIFLDDLQWADEATLQLLNYMADELSQSPVLFLGAYRPEEITNDDPLDEVLRILSRRQECEEISLKPFDWEDTRELLSSMISSKTVPTDFVDPIHSATEGNPLFIKEFIKLLKNEEKLPSFTDDYPTTKNELYMPKVIEDVVSRRLNLYLSKDAQRICSIGSVIGNEISFELLSNVTEMSEIKLLDIIDELLNRKIWKEIPEKDCFIFTHNVVRDVVYNNISHIKRKRLHKIVAECIKEVYEENTEKYYYLAYHYEKAEQQKKAVDNYFKAGREAKNLYAHKNAINMFDKALELCMEKERKMELFLKLGEFNKLVGNFEEAISKLDLLIKETDDTVMKQKGFIELSKVFINMGEYDQAIDTVNQGLNISDEKNEIRSGLLDTKGESLFRKGDYDDAIKIFRNVLNISEDIGDKEEQSQALHNIGGVEIQKGNYEKAREHIKKAIAIRKERSDKIGLWKSYNNLGTSYYYESDMDKALEYYKKSLKIKNEIEGQKGLDGLLNNIALIFNSKGEIKKSLEYHNKSLNIRKKIGDKSGIATSLNNIGSIYEEKGDLDKALEYYNESLKIRQEIDDKAGIGTTINNIGKIHQHEGDFNKAEKYYERSLKIGEDIDNKLGMAYSRTNLADLYNEIGKNDLALKYGKKALHFCEELGAKKEEAKTQRILGRIYRDMKEFDLAYENFERAKEISSKVGDDLEFYKVSYEISILDMEMRKFNEAQENLNTTLDYFSSYGNEIWAEKCQKALIELNEANQ